MCVRLLKMERRRKQEERWASWEHLPILILPACECEWESQRRISAHRRRFRRLDRILYASCVSLCLPWHRLHHVTYVAFRRYAFPCAKQRERLRFTRTPENPPVESNFIGVSNSYSPRTHLNPLLYALCSMLPYFLAVRSTHSQIFRYPSLWAFYFCLRLKSFLLLPFLSVVFVVDFHHRREMVRFETRFVSVWGRALIFFSRKLKLNALGRKLRATHAGLKGKEDCDLQTRILFSRFFENISSRSLKSFGKKIIFEREKERIARVNEIKSKNRLRNKKK